jgi:hypothetical protein
MKRVAVMAVLLSGVGLSALALDGCSGPTPASPDGSFGSSDPFGVGGSAGNGGYAGNGGSGGYAGNGGFAGNGGSAGNGGFAGNGGNAGSGGMFGGNPNQREDAGAQQPERRRDGGAIDPGGGGRRRDAGASPDAAPVAECPMGAMSGEACRMPGSTCTVPAGDGGGGQICTCRQRGGSGAWRCSNP